MKVIKRDGSIVAFDKDKIVNAINKALIEVDGQIVDDSLAIHIAQKIEDVLVGIEYINVEEIQDMVEDVLMNSNRKDVARAYVRYRYKRALVRESNTTDKAIKELLNGESDYWNSENSNKNATVVTTQRDYLAGITSTDIAKRFIFPKELVDAHEKGIIHIHDMDYMAQSTLTNCELINLDDMLQNGTVINKVLIEKPKHLITASTIATQIITAVTSSTYGGATITLTHLAPFVRSSYNCYIKKYQERGFNNDDTERYAKQDLDKEIKDAVQTFNYQLNSMTNTNGQSPFLSVFMYLGETQEYKEELALLIEEFLRQRITGFKNEKGVYIAPAFPKLLYCLEEDNINPDSKYYYLTLLAAECSAKRMVPDYISEKMMKQLKINQYGNGDCYPCMGCRSFLTPDTTSGNIAHALNYQEGKGKYYGRFNCGVTTINLADAALTAKQENPANPLPRFWQLLDERTEMCHQVQKIRTDRLSKTKAKVAPILWCYGALARLDPEDTLDKLIHSGYSTSSLGYAALYECVYSLIGESHTTPRGEKLGLDIMQYLNDKCNKWRFEENIAYSVYGSPIESTTYKFAKCLKKRFGEIKEVTDHNYITNSYHINVREPIDAFNKLEKESKFQQLSPGGAISYTEIPNMSKNIPAVMELINFIYNHIMYAELNTKIDYCMKCGYSGEIEIVTLENGILDWRCPNCGNTDHDKMNIVRRTCGYLGSNYFNQGRTAEINDRVLHL